jgi:Tfp pilus assembly protein FimT
MKKAFTIIEFIVVMSLIVFLSAIMFLGRQGEEERLALQRTTSKLIQDIREVQGMAAAAEEVSCGSGITHSFGIYFHSVAMPQAYILFADCNGNKRKDSSDSILREVNIDKAVEIYVLNPSPLDIVFFPPDPTTSINGNEEGAEGIITFALKSSPSAPKNQKKIKVNSAGRIEIE